MMDYNLIVERIKQALPKEVTLIYVSVTGSRGKGLEAPDSDYDVRCVIISPKNHYMLQR